VSIEGRRDQILDATVAVICRHGLAEARLADVAEEAGVSIGLIQHYFRNRGRLLRAVYLREMRVSAESWRRVVGSEPDPLARLIALLRVCVEPRRPFEEMWSFWLEYWAAARRDPQLRRDSAEIYRIWSEPFRVAIDDGVRDGLFGPTGSTDDVAEALLARIDGLAIRVLLGDVKRKRMLSLLVDGLYHDLGLPQRTPIKEEAA